jgi:hypothetical protein
MSDVEIQEQRAARGREIIAQLRELEAEDRARYEAFAATIKSRNKKHVHRRGPAAAMVAAAIGAPYSDELLRRSACPFVVVSRVALYGEDDLRELAESILDNAIPRRGAPDKRRRKIAAVEEAPVRRPEVPRRELPAVGEAPPQRPATRRANTAIPAAS